MHTARTADPTKIKFNGQQPSVEQTSGRSKDDLVMHGAAAEGMRMANNAYPPPRATRFFDDRFEVAMRSRYVEIAFWVHDRIFDSKS